MSLRLKALKSVRWTAASTVSNLGARFLRLRPSPIAPPDEPALPGGRGRRP